MPFRVRPVGSKVRRDHIDFFLDAIYFVFQFRFDAIQVFRKHLAPFSDKLNLMGKLLGEDAGLAPEIIFYLFFKKELFTTAEP